ncbi:FAD-dependent oxidoreductase [Streptomyces lunaelactis]|nr:NAD(P)/FAD-dependent oxidoreductase [Streptomyces lunaelactis]NUK07191.1 FAD-dependent oxidoreductase [Streptomyces lunaelactis]NUL08912.1 FAD-dependent oxidoreductase [Streptomyces lunaelactis]NUL21771.1 FAD-dependent oxidoreductase [Streptomyces lunaelactis]
MSYERDSTYHGIDWKHDFRASELFSPVRPLFAFDNRRSRKRVCVIGAGLAGLAAAYELSLLGHEVSVFEASDRTGGRVYTHRFMEAGQEVAYGELGAMRIPEDHQLVFDYLKELGLERRGFVSENAKTYLHFGGVRYRRSEWEILMNSFRRRVGSSEIRHPDVVVSEIAEEAKAAIPAQLLWAMFSSGFDGVRDGDWHVRRGLERLSNFESKTLWQQVSQGNASPLTAPEWEMIGRYTLNLPFERAAFTQWLINNVALQNPNKWEIKGGMSALPDMLVDKITSHPKNILKLNSAVTEVSAVDRGENRGVQISWRNSGGETGSEFFEYAVCAAPAPATARIKFPEMPPAKFEALTNISYFPSAKALILCDKRYWELPPDEFAGGASFTDLETQQSWYPSDNAQRDSVATGGDIPLPAQPESGAPSDIGGTFIPREQGISQQPGSFLAAYMYGPTAEHFSSLNETERFDAVMKNVSRYHSWLKDRVVRDFRSYSWDDHSSPGGGAYAFFAPGEFTRYQRALEQPIPTEDPRIFFAGEHVAVLHAWMQSAIQSGVAVARRVAES